MTQNEVALRLAELSIEVADSYAAAGELEEAQVASYVARLYCGRVVRGPHDADTLESARTLMEYALDAYFFARDAAA